MSERVQSQPAASSFAELVKVLDRGELADPRVRALDESAAALPVLLRAVAHAARGDYVAAEADVRRAQSTEPQSALVSILAARVLYVLRRYQSALEALSRAEADPGRVGSRAREQRIELLHRLGWVPESLRSLLASPGDRDRTERLLDIVWRGRDYGATLELSGRLIELGQATFDILMQDATAAARVGDTSRARQRLERASELASSVADTCRVAHLSCDLGDIDLAMQRLQTIDDPARRAAELGRVCLWSNRLDEAEAHAQVPGVETLPMGQRLLGALAVLQGQFEAGVEHLDAALGAALGAGLGAGTDGGTGTARVGSRAASDVEALVWRAEARCGIGDIAGGLADYDRALVLAGEYLPAAKLGRMAADVYGPGWTAALRHRTPETARADSRREPRDGARRADPPPIVDKPEQPTTIEELNGGFEELIDDAHVALDGITFRDMIDLVDLAVRRMGGNRSTTPTRLDEAGRLHRLRRESPRYRARWALELVVTRSPSEVLKAFDDVIAEFPGSSLPVVHRGELNLWLGNYEAAQADFDESLRRNERMRWAYIGSQAVQLVLGDPAESLRVCEFGIREMGGVLGSVFVHRGEALRRLGRFEPALADMRKAVELHPTRVSAWINLALCLFETGEPTEARAWLDRLRTHASAIVSEAEDREGVRLAVADPSEDDVRAVLESGLVAMRGNRSSSCMTYFHADQLRIIPRPRLDVAETGVIHNHDGRDLARVRRLIIESVTRGG